MASKLLMKSRKDNMPLFVEELEKKRQKNAQLKLRLEAEESLRQMAIAEKLNEEIERLGKERERLEAQEAA